MLLANSLILSQVPLMAETLGASSVIFAPIFNILVIAAAALLIIALLQSEFVRNVFAGLGFLGLINYLSSSSTSSSSRHQPPPVHTHSSSTSVPLHTPPVSFSPIHPDTSIFQPTPIHSGVVTHGRLVSQSFCKFRKV
jgi:hypothetical protein